VHVAQPPLSRAISRLERRLGVVLLERTGRPVSLTPAGEALLREARRVLEPGRREISDFSREEALLREARRVLELCGVGLLRVDRNERGGGALRCAHHVARKPALDAFSERC
jgi:Bacterial regulatory helix-turn-helix protein, lysR family